MDLGAILNRKSRTDDAINKLRSRSRKKKNPLKAKPQPKPKAKAVVVTPVESEFKQAPKGTFTKGIPGETYEEYQARTAGK